jgi:hypothetical protein
VGTLSIAKLSLDGACRRSLLARQLLSVTTVIGARLDNQWCGDVRLDLHEVARVGQAERGEAIASKEPRGVKLGPCLKVEATGSAALRLL